MKNKIASFLRQQLQPGDQVIAAVSGGRDSVALLHVLWSLEPELSISVSAAHFNHGLRGAESQRDEDFVRRLCEDMGIPLTVGAGDVAQYARAHGLGIEEAARILRYDFLCALSPAAKIVTAHTAQDNLETLLMHLIRGSGLRGLTGIPPVRGSILRPMLDVSRQEIDAYLQVHQLPHVEDSSNTLDDCLRNRIRHHVLPLLEQENPNLGHSVFRLTSILRMEEEYLEETAGSACASAVRDGALSISLLLTEPEALQYRMLRQFLSPVPELSFRHLEAALRLCRSECPSASCALPGGFTLGRFYDVLRLISPSAPQKPPESVFLSPGQTVSFGPWRVCCHRGPAPERPPAETIVLSAESASTPLFLRCRQPGDIIVLPGGSKKVSRLMIDEKIPALWRDSLPVVCSGDQILAVLPLRTAAFCRPEVGRDSLLLSATRMED